VRLEDLLDAPGATVLGVDGEDDPAAAQALVVVLDVTVPRVVVAAEQPAPETAAALAAPLVVLACRRVGDADVAPLDALVRERLGHALGVRS
jgi:hypothetical protein